jgi:hypothetical protein
MCRGGSSPPTRTTKRNVIMAEADRGNLEMEYLVLETARNIAKTCNVNVKEKDIVDAIENHLWAFWNNAENVMY